MLDKLFKTPERLKILREVVQKDENTVMKISEDTNVSKGLVSRYLNELKKEGILERNGRAYYLKKNALTKAIKILLNLETLKWEDLTAEWIESAALYGSWASGTNTEESDVDLWIKTDKRPSPNQINQLYKKLKIKTSSEVDILILTPEKLESIKKTDTPFYHSLKRSSLLLEGDPI
jgi:predicted nucleotidyltransferase